MEDLRELLSDLPAGKHASAVALWLEQENVLISDARGEVGGEPATSDRTIFATASISKLVIGVAVMQCIEKGLLNLNDTVNTHLPPELQISNPFYPADAITVEMLLRHGSSLCDDENQLCYGSDFRTDGGLPCPILLAEYVQKHVKDNEKVWNNRVPPGKTIHYSNAGFTILGLLVQTVCSRPLQDVVQTSIFNPLDMRCTSFFLRDALQTPGCRVAIPHGTNTSDFYEVAEWPAAQLRSTATDILRFLRCFTARGIEQATILRPETAARMVPDGADEGLAFWGQGFPYSSWYGRGVWEHGGFMQGVRAHAYVWDGGACVLLFNSEVPYRPFADRLLARLRVQMETY